VIAVKKAVMLLLCFAVLTVAAIFLANDMQRQKITFSASSDKSMSNYFNSNAQSSQESRASRPASSYETDYTVKAYKGHIGVYRGDEQVPFKEYQTDIEVLPKPDRDELKRGRTVHTMAEVEKIVEDYDG
jgi:hypothetical protein